MVRVRLTTQERIWVVKQHAQLKSAAKVQEKWRVDFCSEPPTQQSIMTIVNKFSRNGSVADEKRSGRKSTETTTERCEELAAILAVSPHTSSRKLSARMDVSQRTIIRMLRKISYKAFRPRLTHGLLPGDEVRRDQFCVMLSTQAEEDPDLLDSIWWTDEACFKLNGMVNRHNCVYWASENPNDHLTTQLNQPGLTVWGGISSRGVLGPIFFYQTVNAERYRTFR